ncbi:ankyrin repeat domain-containing protein [Nonomuraea terrae]|uniref:ankyrin repeat domain-containing protein n=1 Tax=Nonomuraea terrae TaxID=2530383 RepID=UPI0037B30C9C
MTATGWLRTGWDSWTDLGRIRALLDAGADPNSGVSHFGTPLHAAAQHGSPEVVAELAGRVDDIDALYKGRTALWSAVFADRPGNARALVSAGADPWRPMMTGWPPGRLALAGPTPDLFPVPSADGGASIAMTGAGLGLTEAERAAAAEAGRLKAAIGTFFYEGLGLACVAGITAAEAARRLDAVPADEDDLELIDDDPGSDYEHGLTIVGVTDVPGGCVVTQPWGYTPFTSGVTGRLSVRTVCYAMYANAADGNQGSVHRDGSDEAWDTHPGGGAVSGDEPADEILACYLYQGHALAYCCAGAGLRLTDPRPIMGPPDMWLRLPDQDTWA